MTWLSQRPVVWMTCYGQGGNWISDGDSNSVPHPIDPRSFVEQPLAQKTSTSSFCTCCNISCRSRAHLAFGEPQGRFLELLCSSLHFLLSDRVRRRGRISKGKGERPLAGNSSPRIPGSQSDSSCQRGTPGLYCLASSPAQICSLMFL